MENAVADNVVSLEDIRRRKAAPRPAPVKALNYQYFCLRCEAEEFRLFASGTIHCAKCGSLMRNIEVGSAGPAAG